MLLLNYSDSCWVVTPKTAAYITDAARTVPNGTAQKVPFLKLYVVQM